MVDALRHDYLKRHPDSFLSRLALESTTAELLPTFAFEPDAAYLAGLYPEESDSGAHYWCLPEASPFRWIGPWGVLVDRLPAFPQKLVRLGMKLLLRRFSSYPAVRASGSTQNIPFRYLRYFDFRYLWHLDDPQYCHGETIFDFLRKQNRRWLYLGFPKTPSDAQTVVRRVHSADLSRVDFIFAMISNLDHAGHKFGPDSPQLSAAFELVDESLKDIFEHLKQRYGHIEFLVFGDHGMVAISGVVNVDAELKTCTARPGRDYVYFLDSTLARFWFFNETACREITDRLSALKGGRIISQEDRDRYRMNYSHSRFGDLIYWVDAPRMILPNFYQHSSPDKGMHGYRDEVAANHSAFIHWSNGKFASAKNVGKQPITFVHRRLLHCLNLRPVDREATEPGSSVS